MVLLLGSFVYLLQVTSVVEALSRVPREPLPGGGIPIGHATRLDYFLTREAFLAMHAWSAWVLARSWGAWSRQHALLRITLLLGTVVLALTHAEGFWLAQRGPGIGIW